MTLVGMFAMFHGVAHGAEMPNTAAGLDYAVGFVLATALLHLAGIAAGVIGAKLTDKRANLIAQSAAGLAALGGVGLLAGWPAVSPIAANGLSSRRLYFSAPPVSDVGFLFLIGSAVCKLDRVKVVLFIKTLRRTISLEGPELKFAIARLCNVDELGTHSLALEFGQDIKVIDPVWPKRNEAGEFVLFHNSPNRAGAENMGLVKLQILLGRVQGRKPWHDSLKGAPMHTGGRRSPGICQKFRNQRR
jgi:hypothetical protein